VNPGNPTDIEIRLLGQGDIEVLSDVAEGVFDNPVESRWARAFLDDERHHMVVALEGSRVVGMASAVDYVHPDKAPQLWINEVGVAPSHQQRGIGRRLLAWLHRGLARHRARQRAGPASL
jgi:predicted N-acetyltransferase YhbS